MTGSLGGVSLLARILSLRLTEHLRERLESLLNEATRSGGRLTHALDDG